jgi:ssDNA thymidine ADP-ribosyltransferase, DarT
VDRSALQELHFIAPIANLASILVDGILCHRDAASRSHISIAMAEVQSIRAAVKVPDGTPRGRPLHTYANLYIHARNPMMFVRKGAHESTCVLQISTDVLDLPGVMIADGNAGSRGGYTLFTPMPAGLEQLDADLALAEYWTSPNYFEYCERKRKRCAEVLVPDRVPSDYILGARVSGAIAAAAVAAVAPKLPVTVNGGLFFR